MSVWTAIHSLVSRPSSGAAHLKGVPPYSSWANIAGETSLRWAPANAGEPHIVRSIRCATVVLRCWPIRTRRLRTQGRQRTNMTDDQCWDTQVHGCVPAVYCAANLLGLASSLAHDWATASLFHVSTPVLVHSLLRVARTATEVALLRWASVLVVCGDCGRDGRQLRRSHCFKPSRIMLWGSKPVSRPRLHSTLFISLPCGRSANAGDSHHGTHSVCRRSVVRWRLFRSTPAACATSGMAGSKPPLHSS
jgi:hypothetical protein